jgi:hypothetical protein
MLDGGKVLRSGPLTDLSTTDEVELEIIGDSAAVAAAAQRRGATVELVGSVLHLTATDRDAFEIARDALAEVGAPLRRLAAKRTTLEDVFMGEGSNG